MTQQHPPIREIAATRPLARLPHSCIICGLPIAIGTPYNRIVFKSTDALDRKKALRVAKFHEPRCPPTALDSESGGCNG